MSVLLPFVSRRQLSDAPSQMMTSLERALTDGTIDNGYVSVDTARGSTFLFFHRGRTYSAGEIVDGHFASTSVVEFFHRLPDAQGATYYGTDLPLFLCTAVLFRRAPTASATLTAQGALDLVETVSADSRDAVVSVRSFLFHTLVFCQGGSLVALYSADPSFPTDGEIQERFIRYARAAEAAGDARIDLYTDIALPPTKDAGRSLTKYTEPTATRTPTGDGERPSILIKMSGRPVFRFPIKKAETTVGRGTDNDLALDSLSVSRRHAVIRPREGGLQIVDVGGENGVLFEGQRVTDVLLTPGREVSIGTYELFYPETTPTEPEGAPIPRPSKKSSLERTIAMKGRAKKSMLFYEGQEFRINVPVFLIGSSMHAHVKIDGFLIAPVHLEIQRVAGGAHRVRRLGRWRRLRVGGRPVKEAILEDGLEFSIGEHHFRYAVGESSLESMIEQAAIPRPPAEGS